MRSILGKRRSLFACAFVIATGVSISLPSTAEASCSQASSLSNSLGKQVTSIVANASLSPGGRASKFRAIFRKNADFPTMSRFALGKYWKKLPAGSRAEYYKLVEALVVNVLFGQLESFAGQRYSITTQRCLPKGSKGREFYVEGSVLNANGQKMTNVKWWFVKGKSGMKLFDFQVAGIWLTQQKRAEFTSFLQTRRGDINALLKDLRRRTGG